MATTGKIVSVKDVQNESNKVYLIGGEGDSCSFANAQYAADFSPFPSEYGDPGFDPMEAMGDIVEYDSENPTGTVTVESGDETYTFTTVPTVLISTGSC